MPDQDLLAELLQRFAQSDSPNELTDSFLRDHPDLPGRIGKLWADGFHTEGIPPAAARLLVERGAPLSVHAAAALGFADLLIEMLREQPALVHAKGGDGGTPLHFARDPETAKVLLDAGADINARDEDHRSTPAQWRIDKSPEVTRYLLECGATPDIFLAAALGDLELARKLISEDPNCVGYRIGRLPHFPPIGVEGRGGTILQWTLAFNSFPHQIALNKGHAALFDLLYEKSDPRTRFLVCCVLARRREAEEILKQHPDLVALLPTEDLELLPKYCWETNTSYEAVRLMLDLGFPVAQTESSHGYSSLHNAAWSGDGPLVDLLIARGHPVDLIDPVYQSTPLGFALHDCLVEKRHPAADFAHVIESLLRAGSLWDPSIYPTGNKQVDAVLNAFRSNRALT